MTTQHARQPDMIRPGIVPGILGVSAVFIGMVVFGSEWFLTVLFAVSILAAIMCVFAFQAHSAKTAVFIPLFAIVAVVFNPIVRISDGFSGQPWLLGQVAAAAVFFLGGFLIKTPAPKR